MVAAVSGRHASLTQGRLDEIAGRGVPVPRYARDRLARRIVHIGVGGFCRAHLARYTDALAARGDDWAITGLGLLPDDGAIGRVLRRQDHLYTLIEKGPGEPQAAVVGSVVDFLHAPDPGDERALALIARPETAVLSMTITESGYGELSEAQRARGQVSTFDRIAAALARRRAEGTGALTILSCDNLPANGTAARRATVAAATRTDHQLGAWVEEHCTFPSSMVDRITPQTSAADRTWLREARGVDDGWPVVCEPFRQWVLEDDFAAGRPAWEDDGAIFSDRVGDWELYKLRLLNAGHSCMAYLAALAGITYVHEAIGTPSIRAFVEDLLYGEALPTLTAIPGHPREAYVASVLERFANPGVADQVARLCLDGSAKFPTFLIPTLTAQLEREGPISRGATALAGWARYLSEVDPADQAHDPAGALAREHAVRARAEPRAFLDFREVFPAALRDSPRFTDAFARAYQSIVDRGPLTAMAGLDERPPAGARR